MKLFIIVGILMSSIKIFSQTHIEDISVSGHGLSISENGVDSLYRITLHIRVSDTLFVDSLILSIGSSYNNNDIFSQVYTIGGVNNLQSPESITISQFFFDVVIGDFIFNETRYFKVELVDSTGFHFSQLNKEM